MQEEKSRCPICGKEAAEKYKPFCSSRCAAVDLGKWLGEGYRLKTEESEEESASVFMRKRDAESIDKA